MMRRSCRGILAALLVLACGGPNDSGGGDRVVLATTTSVEDSGLLDVLLPAFGEAHPDIEVVQIAVGSGEALAMGRRKDADLLLTHAPWDEAQFVMGGHGERTLAIMYNHFVIAGPASDPAGVRQAANAVEAFRRIAETESPFLSRGDSSGTHRKEISLWQEVRVAPNADAGGWYMESGVGMGDLLRVATERNAYTLVDRATMLRLGEPTGLTILYDDESDELYNPYSVTRVAGAANAEAAQVLFEWLSGPAQELIARFGMEEYGRPLFVPSPMS